jgi:DNA repair protein RecN (Recombination protein N)
MLQPSELFLGGLPCYMLQQLNIRNYAIIDELSIEPCEQLNTLTGETGAGKSIILGALSLILGERADTSVLINKEEKCVVEARFDVRENKSFRNILKEEDLDDEDLCIIRREIASNGKSRAFINDTPVNLQQLNRLTSLLVDLHQQFGHLALKDDSFQMDVVDAIAKNGALNNQYAALYKNHQNISKQLSSLKEKQTAWQKETDYKKFLLDELLQANFKEQEIETAEQELKQLSHAEKIISVLQAARFLLEEGEQPINNELKKTAQQLQSIADVMKGVEDLQQRISSVHIELKDIAAEIESLEGKISLDPAKMQTLQERLDMGYKLCKKHGVQTTAELSQVQQQLEQDLQATQNLSTEIQQLEAEQQTNFKALKEIAQQLSTQRKKTAPKIAEEVNKLLKLVGMPNAQIQIQIEALKEPAFMGMDEVQFLLDANKSGQWLPVYKAASGGEMSRIMLCIKSLTAKAMHLPTLIFDEVDTGISGEAARQVGLLLKELGNYHQVICITHQPQVAAKGARHFFVYKEADKQQRIATRIRVLEKEERTRSIAQMIGGEQPSDAALQSARELMG